MCVLQTETPEPFLPSGGSPTSPKPVNNVRRVMTSRSGSEPREFSDESESGSERASVTFDFLLFNIAFL